MKNKFLLTVGLLFVFAINGITNSTANEKESENETISVLGTPDVQNLTNALVQEYRKVNSVITIETEQIPVSNVKNSFTGESKVVIASEKLNAIGSEQPLWKMLIGRDVIVPVISSENPFVELIGKQGISAKQLAKITAGNSKQEWGTLLGNEEGQQIHLCILDDEIVQASVSKFLGVNEKNISSIEKVTPAEMKEILKKNKYAIGFSRVLDITDENGQNVSAGIKLLPIDKNGNGVLDYHENIYSNLDNFRRGIWIGKYPHTLVQNVYVVADVLPADEKLLDFLNWVVTDGQQVIGAAGFSELVYNERQSKLNKISSSQMLMENIGETDKAKSGQLLIIIGVVALIVIPGIIFLKRKNSKGLVNVFSNGSQILNEEKINVPNGLYFDKTHTWSFMEKDGSVRVGVDDFLQHITGPYTNLKLKDPGEKILKNEPLITLIQKGKQINIYAPVSGKIKEINEDLVTEPSLINSSPYDEGWIYMIEPANWHREIGFLKIAETYKSWLKKEFSRFKDFLASAANSQNAGDSQLVFQEGGEIMDHPMAEFGPLVWEDFQKNFIDNSDIN